MCKHHTDQGIEHFQHPERPSLTKIPTILTSIAPGWSWNFIQVDSYSIDSFGSAFSHLEKCFWDSSMLLSVLVVHLFSLLSRIPLYGYSTLYLSILLQMGIWVFFSFWQFMNKLLWTLLCMSLADINTHFCWFYADRYKTVNQSCPCLWTDPAAVQALTPHSTAWPCERCPDKRLRPP